MLAICVAIVSSPWPYPTPAECNIFRPPYLNSVLCVQPAAPTFHPWFDITYISAQYGDTRSMYLTRRGGQPRMICAVWGLLRRVHAATLKDRKRACKNLPWRTSIRVCSGETVCETVCLRHCWQTKMKRAAIRVITAAEGGRPLQSTTTYVC